MAPAKLSASSEHCVYMPLMQAEPTLDDDGVDSAESVVDELAEAMSSSSVCHPAVALWRRYMSKAEESSLRALMRYWLWFIALVIAALLATCVYLTLRLHSLGAVVPLSAAGMAPTWNVSQWLSRSENPSFLAHHGVDMRHPVPRQHKVSSLAVTQFRHLVESTGLVAGYNNTLMVGVTNYGYRDFAYNWLCFARRLNLTNFLLACVDTQSCDELRLLGYGRHVLLLDELIHDPHMAECGGATGTHSYRTACFNRQTKMKAQIVLISLLAGYNTVLTDMDISLVHNPFLYMPLQHDWEIQLEPHELCTGWYYNAASANAIRMQTEVLHLMEHHTENDDQVMYNVWTAYQLFLDSADEVKRRIFPLNRQLFPIGQQFGDTKAVLWHNNWLMTADEKRNRSVEKGVYLYQQADTTAATMAYIAQLPADATRVDEMGQPWPIWDRATAPAAPLLVCSVCSVCDTVVPAVSPLRSTFPGPLLTTNFSEYAAPWPTELLQRIK